MNYRLSCYASRVDEKCCFVLERGGAVVDSLVLPFRGTNIKVNMLDIIARGIRCAKGYVKHEDLLVIEIQNRHVRGWLSGESAYSDYFEEVDGVLDVLDSTDCKYRMLFVPKPYASEYLKKNNVSRVKSSSASSVMAEFM